MKKILLGTTGLVGAALLATAASAETPKVTLGGFSDFQAGYSSDDQDGTAGTKDSHGFRNDNEITVKVDGKSGSGLGYGAEINLEADINDDLDGQGTNAARTFTYLEGSFGRAEMGGNKSVGATSRIDASSVAAATGGINGAWTNYIHATPTAKFVTMSKLTGEHGSYLAPGDETYYNATKVSYYTPKFSGFQAGVSYTPELAVRGQSISFAENAGISNVWNAALGYNGTISGVKLGLAGTYESGQGDAAATTAFGNDIRGWNVGATTGFMGATLAGSYAKQSKLGDMDLSDGKTWTLGAGYGMGPVGLSATYLNSTVDQAAAENEFSNFVLGADYKLAPGLTPYAEVSFYDFDSAGTTYDNQGTAVILGTQVAF